MHKTRELIFLIGIFLVAFLLRFYQLGEVPNGFYQDESAIGYNAYSILQTGKDEHGKPFPLYFKSFGDYKLPIYIYSTAASISLFGMNEFAVRLPSAFFGFLTVIAFYFLVLELIKDRRVAVTATLLLAVNPWHLHYTRATFEVSICLFLFVMGTYLLLLSFRKQHIVSFLLGTLCFILNVYSYNVTRILSPLIYLLILFWYRRDFFRLPTMSRTIVLGIGGVLLLPFLLTVFQKGGASSAGGTLIFSSNAVQAPLLELKSYIVDVSPLFAKLFFNTYILTAWQYVLNILSYLSVPFFFLHGSTHGNHGIGNVGQFYLFELATIIIGIALLSKTRPGKFLLLWSVFTILLVALTREAPHATRSFPLLLPLIMFSSFGLVKACDFLLKQKHFVSKGALILLLFFASFNLVYYLTSYYIRFSILYAKQWRLKDKDLVLYLKEHDNEYDKVVFDKNAGFIYTSLLFYLQYPPAEYQSNSDYSRNDNEGFSMLEQIGKYEFREIDWENDLKGRNLIITSAERKPDNVSTFITFSYPKRPVVFSEKEHIYSFPVEDQAYVLIH